MTNMAFRRRYQGMLAIQVDEENKLDAFEFLHSKTEPKLEKLCIGGLKLTFVPHDKDKRVEVFEGEWIGRNLRDECIILTDEEFNAFYEPEPDLKKIKVTVVEKSAKPVKKAPRKKAAKKK
jgi:hypothetical protein